MIFTYIKRYLISIWGLLLVKYYALKKKESTINQLNRKFKRIIIICPGPSAIKIRDEIISDSDCVIFINHAIKLFDEVNSKNSVSSKMNFYYFSVDTPRTSEAFDLSHEFMSKVNVIFTPYHYIHLPYFKYLDKIDILLNPRIGFSWTYGFQIRNNGPKGFSEISHGKISACGFGTLVSSLQLAFTMGQRNIVLFGCDFGSLGQEKYFDQSIPIRMDTPFNKIENDFIEISKIIRDKHWNINIK